MMRDGAAKRRTQQTWPALPLGCAKMYQDRRSGRTAHARAVVEAPQRYTVMRAAEGEMM